MLRPCENGRGRLGASATEAHAGTQLRAAALGALPDGTYLRGGQSLAITDWPHRLQCHRLPRAPACCLWSSSLFWFFV